MTRRRQQGQAVGPFDEDEIACHRRRVEPGSASSSNCRAGREIGTPDLSFAEIVVWTVKLGGDLLGAAGRHEARADQRPGGGLAGAEPARQPAEIAGPKQQREPRARVSVAARSAGSGLARKAAVFRMGRDRAVLPAGHRTQSPAPSRPGAGRKRAYPIETAFRSAGRCGVGGCASDRRQPARDAPPTHPRPARWPFALRGRPCRLAGDMVVKGPRKPGGSGAVRREPRPFRGSGADQGAETPGSGRRRFDRSPA